VSLVRKDDEMKREMIEGDTYRPYMLCVASLVPEWLESVETLKPGPKLCYARLARHEGKEGSSFPGLRSLAASLGTNERQVQRWVAELKREKLIAAKQRGLGQTNVYTFLVHPFMDGAKLLQGGTIEVTRTEDPSRQLSPVSEDDPGVLDPPVMANIRESVEENQGRESKQGELAEEESEIASELKRNALSIMDILERDHDSAEPRFPEIFAIASRTNTRRSGTRDQKIKRECRFLLELLGVSGEAYSKTEWLEVLDEVVDNQSHLLRVIEQVLKENGIEKLS
jgi:hypothetical protein